MRCFSKWASLCIHGAPSLGPSLTGSPPFYGKDEDAIFNEILHKELDMESVGPWPSISAPAKDLVSRLLVRDPAKWVQGRGAPGSLCRTLQSGFNKEMPRLCWHHQEPSTPCAGLQAKHCKPVPSTQYHTHGSSSSSSKRVRSASVARASWHRAELLNGWATRWLLSALDGAMTNNTLH